MNKEIFVKYFSLEPDIELQNIGFDLHYLNIAKFKYETVKLKIFNLKSPEANILKQLCLSLGFDCAVSKGVVNCELDYTDAVITPSVSQLKILISKLLIQPYRLKALAAEFQNILSSKKEPIFLRKTVFDWNRTYIVGILNVTPDSFSDGGEFLKPDLAFNKAVQLINEGVDIIDIGGESTRPGFDEVPFDVECQRVLPVIKKIRSEFSHAVISIDTRKANVADLALSSGADIVNCVDNINDEMIDVLKKYSSPFVVCCSSKFDSGDIVDNVYQYFRNTIVMLLDKGIERKNIILDVGIGFNKTIDENFELIKRSFEFNSLNQPMFWGISRKSFIQKTFSLPPKECDFASLVYSNYLIEHGADFVRTHDTLGIKQSLNYLSRVLR